MTEITEINLISNIEKFRKNLQITEKLCQFDRNYGNNYISNIEKFRKNLHYITEKLCQYDRNYANQSHF